MARILITGSSDGLGARAANALISRGHSVYVHGRNAQRTQDAERACPGAKGAFSADLSKVEETRKMAEEVNGIGDWDAIIHNAGIMRNASGSTLFTTNTLSPYILTCLVKPPKRLIFLSSQLHQGGDPSLKNIQQCGYSDSKLHNTMMAFAFARKFPNVEVSSLDPGWVQTKMGGSGASDDINAAVDTYVMLAEGGNPSGKHWYHCKERSFQKAAADQQIQEKLLKELEGISGVSVPKL